MIVTQIIELSKNRSKVYIDQELAFVLYKGELHLYAIQKGHEMPKDIYEEITGNVLVKRAKNRALNLLVKKDYTEAGIRRKLAEGYYSEEQIDATVRFLKGYGYIDDGRFVKNYFAVYIQSKPRQYIIRKLVEKGIPNQLIMDMIDEIYEEESNLTVVLDEIEIGRKLLEKKRFDINASMKERQKAYGYLLRNGISNENAIKLLKEC